MLDCNLKSNKPFLPLLVMVFFTTETKLEQVGSLGREGISVVCAGVLHTGELSLRFEIDQDSSPDWFY